MQHVDTSMGVNPLAWASPFRPSVPNLVGACLQATSPGGFSDPLDHDQGRSFRDFRRISGPFCERSELTAIAPVRFTRFGWLALMGWPENVHRRSPLAGEGTCVPVRSLTGQLLRKGCRYFRVGLIVLMVVVGGVLPRPIWAEANKKDAAAAQAIRKAQGMLRQLSQEKAALEAEKTALQEQVKKLEARVKELEPLQGELERHKSALETLKSAQSALESQLHGERERGRTLQHQQREVLAQARKIQADNNLLVQAIKEREEWIARCSALNKDMLDTNRELVERYKEKGFWDKLAEIEPLTGIGKVKAENVEQEYRFRLKDLTVTPFESQVPPPQADSTSSGERSSEQDDEEDAEEEPAVDGTK